ncbi:MAG: sulfatase, partial [Acidimicrobiales bacterium]
MATEGGGWRREGRYLIELVGITAVTVAQPVFNVVQQAPEELVSLAAGPTEIVLYALLVVLGPPLVLWLIEQPFRLLGPTVRDRVHVAIVGLGVGLFAIEIIKSTVLDAQGRSWLIFAGLVVAVAAGWLFLRSEKARSILRYLALAAPAFLALFLLASPVADLVVSDGVDAAEIEVGNPVPVVLIAFDEFPEVSLLDGEGRIDADAYPGFADLAGDSTWFRNNTGVSP